MKANISDVADFYQQLALLVKSDLPLPESLRQLASYFPKHDFKEAIRKMADDVSRGEKLSDAVKRYPQYFDPFHVRLITAGETSGALSEILFNVARLARFGQLLAAKVRDLFAYPALTIHLCFAVLFFLSVYVVPYFRLIFDDLLEGAGLPALTKFVMDVAMPIYIYRWPLLILESAFLAFTIWLFTPFFTAHRVMLAIVNYLPGSCRIVDSLDSARLCGMLSAFIKEAMPLPEALRTVSRMVERRTVSSALCRAATNIEAGSKALEALAQEKAIDRLVVLTFQHAPEAELGAELRKLGELFEQRVNLSARSAAMTWTIIAMVTMAFGVGFTAIALFVPLVSIISTMAA